MFLKIDKKKLKLFCCWLYSKYMLLKIVYNLEIPYRFPRLTAYSKESNFIFGCPKVILFESISTTSMINILAITFQPSLLFFIQNFHCLCYPICRIVQKIVRCYPNHLVFSLISVSCHCTSQIKIIARS